MEEWEVERTADAIIMRYDEVFFAAMNQILQKVKGETSTPDIDTQRNLGHIALEAPE